LQVKAIAQPFIDKMNADPLSDHHALHNEMQVAVLTFLKEHNPESLDETNRALNQLNRL